VNGKQTKKLRKEIKRAQVGSFSEFAETINTAPFKLRLKIAIKILRAKL
jgi:hypothetical protein